jgi:uncharacterized protein
MGQAVVHFEVIGKDADKLKGFCSELFGWQIDSNNPMNYGIVQREGNTTGDGIGIGGGVAPAQEGSDGWVTFDVATDDVEGSLQKAESLGGTRVMGPMEVPEGPEIGLFNDPEGTWSAWSRCPRASGRFPFPGGGRGVTPRPLRALSR